MQLTFPFLYLLVPLRPPRPIGIRKETNGWDVCQGEGKNFRGGASNLLYPLTLLGKSAVNKTTCDGVLQAGRVDLVKMVTVLLRGLHPASTITTICFSVLIIIRKSPGPFS